MPCVEDGPEDKASCEDWEETKSDEVGSRKGFALLSGPEPLGIMGTF